MRGAAAVALALAATAGCKRSAPRTRPADAAVDAAVAWLPPAVVLARVAIVTSGDAEGAVVEREYGRRMGRCLIERGVEVVALPSQAPPDHPVLTAGLTLELSGRTVAGDLELTATATLAWDEATELPPARVTIGGAAPLEGGAPAAAAFAVADRLLEPVCQELATRVALLGGDLGPGLTSDDPTLASWALSLAPLVRPPDVAGQVVALIDRPSPIGDTALATLVKLGDASVVPALIARIDLGARGALPVRVDAVAALGGPDAEAFLQVLVDHVDADVAAHARAGLARLRGYSPSQ